MARNIDGLRDMIVSPCRRMRDGLRSKRFERLIVVEIVESRQPLALQARCGVEPARLRPPRPAPASRLLVLAPRHLPERPPRMLSHHLIFARGQPFRAAVRIAPARYFPWRPPRSAETRRASAGRARSLRSLDETPARKDSNILQDPALTGTRPAPESRREFHGHTSWQISQPKICIPIPARSSSGIGPCSSMVRYAMHRRASIDHQSPAGTNASVGQASMQRVHVPHRSGGGRSGVRSSEVISSPEKKPRPALLIDQTRILADPAEPRQPRVSPFQHGSRVDTRLPLTRLNFLQSRSHFLQPRGHPLMIILTKGVTRNDPVPFRHRPNGLRVKFSDTDHRFRVGQKLSDIAPHFRPPIGQIPHRTGVSLVDPVLIPLEIVRRLSRGYAGEFESALLRDLFYGIGSQVLG